MAAMGKVTIRRGEGAGTLLGGKRGGQGAFRGGEDAVEFF